MCIIIDNCLTGDYLQKKQTLEPVRNYIEKGGRVAINRALFEEYPPPFQAVMIELDRAGKIRRFGQSPLEREVRAQLASNDEHVVELVRVSRIRVVCTNDNDLISDLKNTAIIPRPACKIYRHAGAKKVLNGCCT